MWCVILTGMDRMSPRLENLVGQKRFAPLFFILRQTRLINNLLCNTVSLINESILDRELIKQRNKRFARCINYVTVLTRDNALRPIMNVKLLIKLGILNMRADRACALLARFPPLVKNRNNANRGISVLQLS